MHKAKTNKLSRRNRQIHKIIKEPTLICQQLIEKVDSKHIGGLKNTISQLDLADNRTLYSQFSISVLTSQLY